MKYNRFQKDLGLDKTSPVDYVKDDENFVYSVAAPYYLGTDYNLSVSEEIFYDEKGEPQNKSLSSLTIWPELNGDYRISVSYKVLEKENIETPDGQTATADSFNFYIDKSGQPTQLIPEDERRLFEENKDAVDKLLIKADNMWHIFA